MSLNIPVVATFLSLLSRADTVAIDGSTGVSWALDDISGNPESELVHFQWKGPDRSYSVKLTEGQSLTATGSAVRFSVMTLKAMRRKSRSTSKSHWCLQRKELVPLSNT